MEPMLARLCRKIESAPIRPENNEILRGDIQEAYCLIRNRLRRDSGPKRELEELEQLCRRRILEMDLAAASSVSELRLSPVDIDCALEEFCDAMDIAAGTGGRHVDCRTGGDGQILICCPELVLKGVGFLIRRMMLEGWHSVLLRTQFTPDYFLIHFHGSFRRPVPSAFQPGKAGPEISAALSIARRHGGSVVELLLDRQRDPVLYFPLRLSANAPPAEICGFTDYLCSRISPVYTCLYQLI